MAIEWAETAYLLATTVYNRVLELSHIYTGNESPTGCLLWYPVIKGSCRYLVYRRRQPRRLPVV